MAANRKNSESTRSVLVSTRKLMSTGLSDIKSKLGDIKTNTSKLQDINSLFKSMLTIKRFQAN